MSNKSFSRRVVFWVLATLFVVFTVFSVLASYLFVSYSFIHYPEPSSNVYGGGFQGVYWQNVLPSEQCYWSVEEYDVRVMSSSTGSMRPYMYAGDVLLTKPLSEGVPLVVGDVVATDVLHRVVSISRHGWFMTKGDNVAVVDSKRYTSDDVQYVVCGVLRGGAH